MSNNKKKNQKKEKGAKPSSNKPAAYAAKSEVAPVANVEKKEEVKPVVAEKKEATPEIKPAAVVEKATTEVSFIEKQITPKVLVEIKDSIVKKIAGMWKEFSLISPNALVKSDVGTDKDPSVLYAKIMALHEKLAEVKLCIQAVNSKVDRASLSGSAYDVIFNRGELRDFLRGFKTSIVITKDSAISEKLFNSMVEDIEKNIVKYNNELETFNAFELAGFNDLILEIDEMGIKAA